MLSQVKINWAKLIEYLFLRRLYAFLILPKKSLVLWNYVILIEYQLSLVAKEQV